MNTNKSGGNEWGSAKFVKRVEMALMQFVILNKARESQGGVTKENLQQVFRGNLQMGDHFEHCLRELVSDGHLKQEGNKYSVTDDGREDVQKLQTLVLEIPNVVHGGGGIPQKQGVAAQKTTGGQGMGSPGGNLGGMGGGATGGQSSQGVGKSGISGNVGTGGAQGSGSTGQTLGNQGDFGRNNPGKADTGSEWKQGQVNKGGATSPSVPDQVGDKTGSNLKAKNDRI